MVHNAKTENSSTFFRCAAMIALRRYFKLPDAMLLLVAAVWGTSYGVAKQTLLFYPVLGVLALRFGIIFVLLSPSLAALRHTRMREVGAAVGTGLMLLAVLATEMSE